MRYPLLTKAILYSFVIGILFTACQSKADKQLEQALQLAGENRKELEKVLDHYNNDPLKLKAAKFLIANMPGHAGYDSLYIKDLQPIYDKHEAISQKYEWERPTQWVQEIDSLWYQQRLTINRGKYIQKQDINVIKAIWLINEIDRSFKAWQENAYTQNASFEDFCQYILPYRFNNELCLDNCRDTFYQRHSKYFSDKSKDFRDITDSLHYKYSHISHSAFAAASLPILNVKTYEQIKRGSCATQTWFNALLMSSLGMAVAIDYVPAWGNRSGGHTWNALIVDGKTYAFEPFWDKERWKYNRIYNNETFDILAGKFRLAKVFRQTYEYHFEGPMIDKRVRKENIPPLFLNPMQKDVSSQYFKPKDITVEITEKFPPETYYCYLCIFSSKGWTPIQWGEIDKNGQVTFEQMGRDIVYLPAFYINGRIIPASHAFLLEQDGTFKKIECSNKRCDITVRTTSSFPKVHFEQSLFNSYFTGSNEIDTPVDKQDLLYSLNDTVDLWYNKVGLSTKNKYRYIHFYHPEDTVSLCEIQFFEKKGQQAIPIKDINIIVDYSSVNQEEKIEQIADNLSATGFTGFSNNGQKCITFDLGKARTISSLCYIPYAQSRVNKDTDFELFYWDNAWKSGGIVKGGNSFITFKNVPEGSIYWIKPPQKSNDFYLSERIFGYKDGIIYWY